MHMTLIELLTLIALVAGPISAIFITRHLDDKRQYAARRMDVFRTLMRTRRTVLHPDHIGALNLVEIEYARDPAVLTAWKALFTNFGSSQGRLEAERTDGITDKREIERQALLTKLLHAMATSLGLKIEQLEIFEGGYTPQFWGNVESDQEVIRKFVVDLAHARAVVPIGVIDYRQVTPPGQTPHST
jgi:hypothetical protein